MNGKVVVINEDTYHSLLQLMAKIAPGFLQWRAFGEPGVYELVVKKTEVIIN